jgi:glutamate-5-semialdehyde dehydrogenase
VSVQALTDIDRAILAVRPAARRLGRTGDSRRRDLLLSLADRLLEQREQILAANAEDLAAATDLAPALVHRLGLDRARLEELAKGVRTVATLKDPLGQVRIRRLLDDGLVLTRRTVPLGVLAVVFEARPDAVVQIGALALRSGNGLILKGGAEAARSTAVLAGLLRQCLADAGLDPDALLNLPDRAALDRLLAVEHGADLIVARGSKAMVQSLQARSPVPVMGHAEGICHIYLDRGADPAMALHIVRDAKLGHPAACNAVETLLVHREAAALLPALVASLPQIDWRGCPLSRAQLAGSAAAGRMAEATEADWDTEYGAPVLAVKVVEDLDAALGHIARHGSGHTEAIVTPDPAAAARFLDEVDAAGVYHNASTRFADGYRYGFGAEVGISTGRLHARGPVGLDGLVTTKDTLEGSGQAAADYGPQGRNFLHRDL